MPAQPSSTSSGTSPKISARRLFDEITTQYRQLAEHM
jgi:hypothetical protein